MFSGNVRRGQ